MKKIKALTEDLMKEKGALMIAHIKSGLEEYESLILPGTYEEFRYFIEGLIEKNGEGNCFVDFYYSLLPEDSRTMLQSILTKEDMVILDSLDLTEGIYYPLTKELLPLMLKLTTREMLFSTFYFTKYPCTLWGNYDMQYPILFLNEETKQRYDSLIRQVF